MGTYIPNQSELSSKQLLASGPLLGCAEKSQTQAMLRSHVLYTFRGATRSAKSEFVIVKGLAAHRSPFPGVNDLRRHVGGGPNKRAPRPTLFVQEKSALCQGKRNMKGFQRIAHPSRGSITSGAM